MSSSNVRKGEDGTLARNSIKQWRSLIAEYELIKAKKHTRYKFVTDFYKANGFTRQNFIKYYNRFKQSSDENHLLPQKRGPRYKKRKIPAFIEQKVVNMRLRGLNKYEIYSDLKQEIGKFTPSTSTIYNIFKRNNLNRLKPKMKQAKRKIIKQKAGELGHIDCHYLPKNIIKNNSNRLYLISLIDDQSRVAWFELVDNIKSLTVMFATLKMINSINSEFGIKFKEIMTDNGAEFGSGKNSSNSETNPFKRLMQELGIKQRFIKPYRPQTNGKVERLWKTINYDLLDDMLFESKAHLKDELLQYIAYYNYHRQHQAINNLTPANNVKS